MRFLVTGAGGFLGRRVVASLVKRGGRVRALVRPASGSGTPEFSSQVEVVRADLRADPVPAAVLDGVDCVVHLAASFGGGEGVQFADTVLGTERLLAAMERSGPRRLVLASTFAVYDWNAAVGTLDEETPLDTDPHGRDAYAMTKAWQERLVREVGDRPGWTTTILRPGYIWGEGSEYVWGLGPELGKWLFVVGPRRALPLTYVENCSDCFAEAATNDAAAGETFNVVDGHPLSAWRYARRYCEWLGEPRRCVAVPYGTGLGLARFAARTNQLLFRGEARLPALLVPSRFEAMFKPLRFSNQKLRRVLGWTAPVSVEAALDATFPPTTTASP